MVRSGSPGGRSPRNRASAPRKSASKRSPSARREAPKPPASAPEEPRTFTLGAIPGATPGKWIAAWRERMPHVGLELRTIPVSRQRVELEAGAVDAAIVRLPIEHDELHVIRLYEEVTVAVVPLDSAMTAAEEIELADLSGEVVIVPRDDVLGAEVPNAAMPTFDAPAETEEAIALVAAGVGVVLVPLSLSRLHARRDVEVRPVRDAPVSSVGLAWPKEATTADVETFIGIVRGRTANSSR